MNAKTIWLYIVVMAGVTYLIRVFSAAVGFAAAVLRAYRGAALLPVALAACGVVFCTEWMMRLF